MEEMYVYERTISLKTIWLTITKRWLSIVLIFAPIALATLIVTQGIMQKSYSSSSSLSINAVVNTTQHAVVKSSVADSSLTYTIPMEDGGSQVIFAYREAETKLEAAGTKHANGSKITASEIFSGMGVNALATNATDIVITFTSSDSSITAKVLDEIGPMIVSAVKQKGVGLDGMVYNAASAAKKVSKETTYMLIGFAAGFVVACVLPFIDEILSDEVHDGKDIASLGGDSFEIKASKKLVKEAK